jgi:hypothetical protein
MRDATAAHALLGFTARPHMPPDLLPEVARRAARIDDWPFVFDAAERHGVAPLVRDHLTAAGVALPVETERQAAALFVRHRRANTVRIAALTQILDAFEARGIDVRVLKGPALLSMVYGNPARRPFSDLDLLVPRAAAFRGQEILREIGYHAPGRGSAASLDRHHHLPVASRKDDGVAVQVELHHDALSKDHGASIALDDPREPPMAIEVGGRTALALGPHEMIRHLTLHLVGPLPRPLRLIWIADIVGFAEVTADRIDWETLARLDPVVVNVLGLAGGVTPLPQTLVPHVPTAVAHRMRAISSEDDAWTWVPPRHEPGGHWMRFRRSLDPPAWWLAVKYSGDGRGSAWRLRMRHLQTLARVGTRRVPMGWAEAGPR